MLRASKSESGLNISTSKNPVVENQLADIIKQKAVLGLTGVKTKRVRMTRYH